MIFIYGIQTDICQEAKKDIVSESLQDSQVYIVILATMVPIILGQALYQKSVR